jgi:DNA helicase-2/ATP-dependent DNA helicase PcrA
MPMWQAACAGGAKNKGLAGFVSLIEGMRAEANGLGLAETVEIVLARSGLIEHYKTEKEGESRIENLNELTNAALAFVSESDDQSLTAFLSHAALEAGEHEAGANADAVQMMTVHAAKGLEFHTVFITGLEEGLFPHENTLTEADGLEEERRLMYVALTRARRRLFISHAQMRMLHGQPRYGLPSRFLEEIPAALVHSLNTRRAVFPSPASGGGARGEGVSSTPPSRDLPHKIGARVSHPRYGEGVVSGYQGQGGDMEIKVAFPKVGDKWFILEYVKLEPRG